MLQSMQNWRLFQWYIKESTRKEWPFHLFGPLDCDTLDKLHHNWPPHWKAAIFHLQEELVVLLLQPSLKTRFLLLLCCRWTIHPFLSQKSIVVDYFIEPKTTNSYKNWQRSLFKYKIKQYYKSGQFPLIEILPTNHDRQC